MRAHVNGTRPRSDPECLFPVRSPSPGPRLALALPIARQETYGFCSVSTDPGALSVRLVLGISSERVPLSPVAVSDSNRQVADLAISWPRWDVPQPGFPPKWVSLRDLVPTPFVVVSLPLRLGIHSFFDPTKTALASPRKRGEVRPIGCLPPPHDSGRSLPHAVPRERDPKHLPQSCDYASDPPGPCVATPSSGCESNLYEA